MSTTVQTHLNTKQFFAYVAYGKIQVISIFTLLTNAMDSLTEQSLRSLLDEWWNVFKKTYPVQFPSM